MRICHVIESASGGSSRVVVDLLRDQTAAGHDVTLIYSPIRSETRFLRSLSSIGERLRVHPLPMQRAVGAHDAVSCWRLLRLFDRLGPFDVVHAHSSKAGALTRAAGMFLRDTVVVYTPHAFATLAPGRSRVYRVVEWAASLFCDAVIVGSRQEYEHARDALRLPASRLRLIRMGVASAPLPDRATARRALGLDEATFVVGFVGRLAAQKNPLRLARVFGRIAKARPGLRFVVVGDGELRDAFISALDAESVRAATILAPDVEGREAMAAFDCLVCTSDYESFGLIFPEALAAGAPIVSPPVGVADEAIAPGETGVLTGFASEDIARGVLEIAATTPEARARMAVACRARARLFDAGTTMARHRALYEELLAARRGARR